MRSDLTNLAIKYTFEQCGGGRHHPPTRAARQAISGQDILLLQYTTDLHWRTSTRIGASPMTSTESSPAGPAAPVRDRAAHDRNVRSLMRPRSVAVIGASAESTRIGGIIVSVLQRYKFPGQVFLVNPKYEEIQGFRCYPSLADIPADAEIDVAIVYLSTNQVNNVVRACGERGVKGLAIITAGFAEVGGNGVRLQHELMATANSYDMAMCGPNSAGIANFVADFVCVRDDELHRPWVHQERQHRAAVGVRGPWQHHLHLLPGTAGRRQPPHQHRQRGDLDRRRLPRRARRGPGRLGDPR